MKFEAQMYKVFINETAFLLCNTNFVKNLQADDKNLINRYPGKQKFLHHYIDMLEKGSKYDSVTLYADDEKTLLKDFFDLYKIIEAAGGLVMNDKNEALLIFRLKYWDLPKGKIEKNEAIESAAIREVEEETGLKNITINRFLCHTYHTYKIDKKRILKKTHWFLMHSNDESLTPQTEENIEAALWMSKESFYKEPRVVYKNILEVMHQGDFH